MLASLINQSISNTKHFMIWFLNGWICELRCCIFTASPQFKLLFVITKACWEVQSGFCYKHTSFIFLFTGIKAEEWGTFLHCKHQVSCLLGDEVMNFVWETFLTRNAWMMSLSRSGCPCCWQVFTDFTEIRNEIEEETERTTNNKVLRCRHVCKSVGTWGGLCVCVRLLFNSSFHLP